MTFFRQQVWGRLCTVLLSITGLLGCEGAPARTKRWRHEQTTDVALKTSPVLEREGQLAKESKARDQRLRIYLDADPVHLDPLLPPTEWTRRITEDTVFETLLRFRATDGSASGGYENRLAERHWRSPSGREIRIDVRHGVAFHDGGTLSAVDVQFSLDAARHPRRGPAYLRELLTSVTAVEIISPYTVRVRLSEPDAYVERALAAVPIVPAHVYKNRTRKNRFLPIGTGPYRIAESSDEAIRLRANSSYWGEAPTTREIVFLRLRDGARALSAAKSGAMDLIPRLIDAHVPRELDRRMMDRFVPLRLRPPVFRYAVFNVRELPFADPRVRMAAVGFSEPALLTESVMRALSRKTTAPIWPGGPVHGEETRSRAPDLAESLRLLAGAGWVDEDGDGVRELLGEGRLSITVLATEKPDAERDAVLAALRRAGFAIDLRIGPSAVLRNRMKRGAFDLAFVEWSGLSDQDISALISSDGRHNHGGFHDDRVDALVRRLKRTFRPSDRAKIATRLAERLTETWPWIPLPSPDPLGVVHRRVAVTAPWNGWISLRDVKLKEVL